MDQLAGVFYHFQAPYPADNRHYRLYFRIYDGITIYGPLHYRQSADKKENRYPTPNIEYRTRNRRMTKGLLQHSIFLVPYSAVYKYSLCN